MNAILLIENSQQSHEQLNNYKQIKLVDKHLSPFAAGRVPFTDKNECLRAVGSNLNI